MNDYKLYTVGHSNQSLEGLLQLLQRNGVNCVVDVRSVPASKYAPQFNQDFLGQFMLKNGIMYLFFGKEFGARRTDCLDEDGRVDFEKAVGTPLFQQGVERLLKGLEKGFCISLLCSEADPLECHRFAMVARYFYSHGIEVLHIMKDSSAIPHDKLEQKMIESYLHSKKYHLSEVDQLFGTYTAEEQLEDAYRLKNKEIGYRMVAQMEEAF